MHPMLAVCLSLSGNKSGRNTVPKNKTTKMKTNQHILKLVCPSSSGTLLNDQYSGTFLNEITRAPLLTVVLGISVLLATGCASMATGISAKLISPVPNRQEAAEADGNHAYQPTRSPALSDFFGS